jgi:hypothetical protein
MAVWDNLPIVIALPLALVAALMSGSAEARQEVSAFIAEAMAPQAADMGGDPGYLLGMANDAVWPLPARSQPFTPYASRDLAAATD